jgi:hypothetical protein
VFVAATETGWGPAGGFFNTLGALAMLKEKRGLVSKTHQV